VTCKDLTQRVDEGIVLNQDMIVFRLELLLGETSLANLALFRRMTRWCAIRDYKRSHLFIVIRRRSSKRNKPVQPWTIEHCWLLLLHGHEVNMADDLYVMGWYVLLLLKFVCITSRFLLSEDRLAGDWVGSTTCSTGTCGSAVLHSQLVQGRFSSISTFFRSRGFV